LQAQGIETRATLHWNLVTARLIETAVARGEGKLSADGPLVVETGEHTGRSAQDKFMVRDDETRDTVWWGKTNKPMSPDDFAALKEDFFAALGQKENLFVRTCWRIAARAPGPRACRDRAGLAQPVHPHHAGPPQEHELRKFIAEYTIIDLPSFRADPARHGCRPTVIAVNFTEKLILIGGTAYAGEMKKSVFGILNYLLPVKGVMPMHCSANIGPDGDRRRCSSACRAPARPRCRPTPAAR
jgi:phosphoenolpyruvate carboxykinase (ATP)